MRYFPLKVVVGSTRGEAPNLFESFQVILQTAHLFVCVCVYGGREGGRRRQRVVSKLAFFTVIFSWPTIGSQKWVNLWVSPVTLFNRERKVCQWHVWQDQRSFSFISRASFFCAPRTHGRRVWLVSPILPSLSLPGNNHCPILRICLPPGPYRNSPNQYR